MPRRVDIRSTLVRAQAEGILDAAVANLLRQIAKELFYPERSYPHILALAAAREAPLSQLDALRRWLPQGAVNQKREDALLMLRTMRDFLQTNPEPKRISWTLEESDFWSMLKRRPDEIQIDPHGSPDTIVLEELRRDPKALRASAAALGWWLDAESARRESRVVDATALLQHSAEFCHGHNLSDADAVPAWLEKNQCGREHLERILASQALASRAQTLRPAAWTPAFSTICDGPATTRICWREAAPSKIRNCRKTERCEKQILILSDVARPRFAALAHRHRCAA